MMILENMLTNIYRNSAYTDEMHSLIMQAVTVIAGECFRVKFTALQRAFSPCESGEKKGCLNNTQSFI